MDLLDISLDFIYLQVEINDGYEMIRIWNIGNG